MKNSLFAIINSRLIPVLVLEDITTGLKMCECLCKNGLPVAEITFRTTAAAEIIAETVKHFPQMLVGAGILLKADDLKRAQDAGARFGVAPGFNPTVVKAAAELAFPFAPGICSPSELEQAYELGCRVFKFFPAEASGGVPFLKALIAPYRSLGIRFIPTGGITPANARTYLELPEVLSVGGTWLGKHIPDWQRVTDSIREAASL